MTFRIANNQIHIGWPETLSLISVMFGLAWGARAYYDGFIQDKQETNKRLAGIERQLAIKNGTDSTQTAGIAKVESGLNHLSIKLDSFALSLFVSHNHNTKRVKSTGVKFYTERWVNGQLQLTEVKQN